MNRNIQEKTGEQIIDISNWTPSPAFYKYRMFIFAVPAIYDVQSAYPEGSVPTIKHLLSGGRCEVHLSLRYWTTILYNSLTIGVFEVFKIFFFFDRRIPVKDVPCKTNEEIAAWCQQLFVEKVLRYITQYIIHLSVFFDVPQCIYGL